MYIYTDISWYDITIYKLYHFKKVTNLSSLFSDSKGWNHIPRSHIHRSRSHQVLNRKGKELRPLLYKSGMPGDFWVMVWFLPARFFPVTLLGVLSDLFRGSVTSIWVIKRSLGRSWWRVFAGNCVCVFFLEWRLHPWKWTNVALERNHFKRKGWSSKRHCSGANCYFSEFSVEYIGGCQNPGSQWTKILFILYERSPCLTFIIHWF